MIDCSLAPWPATVEAMAKWVDVHGQDWRAGETAGPNTWVKAFSFPPKRSMRALA